MFTTESDELRKVLINQKTIVDEIFKPTREKGTKITCNYLQELSKKGDANWVEHTDHEDYSEASSR